MKINVTAAGRQLHRLLKRCAVERVVITRRGKPIVQLKPFPKSRQEMDAEILQRVAEHAPFDLNDLISGEEEPHGR